MQVSQKITPFLSFHHQAEEAARYYVSVFRDASIGRVLRMPDPETGDVGSVIAVDFQIGGTNLTALNVGQEWKFSDALSLLVSCESQQEVDDLWEKLSEGGETVQCGWVRDRYGVAWQVCPSGLLQMLSDPNPATAHRVLHAMMQMTKLDIEQLEQAYRGV